MSAPWSDVAEGAVDAVTAALEPRLRKLGDDLYYDLLFTVKDYLLENVLQGVQGDIESANRQAQHDRQRAHAAEQEVDRLRHALATFAILANPDTDHLPDEHVVSLTYDDTEIDSDLGGPNTLLGERYMRAFRAARGALAKTESQP